MTGYILSVVLTSMTCTDSGHVMYNTAIPVMKFEDTKLDRLLPISAKTSCGESANFTTYWLLEIPLIWPILRHMLLNSIHFNTQLHDPHFFQNCATFQYNISKHQNKVNPNLKFCFINARLITG